VRVKRGKLYTSYRCVYATVYSNCEARSVAEYRVDGAVVPILSGAMRGMAEDLPKTKSAPKSVDPRVRLQAARDRLIDAYASGILDKETFAAKIGAIDNDLAHLVTEAPAPPKIDPSVVAALVTDIGSRWDQLTGAEKRTILTLLAPKIVLTNRGALEVTVYGPLFPSEGITVVNRRGRAGDERQLEVPAATIRIPA